MAIAHLATEYVFSDFLLKEPSEPKFKGLRLELAVDKMVTFIAVGLPLLLISLAFAQEISTGSQIACFPPGSFSWRQASFVDSYCWASVHQQDALPGLNDSFPLRLHKFFPYILLLVAILLYLPSLVWRFTAAPRLCSDLKFIMEELDRAYNRAIQAAGSAQDSAAEDAGQSPGEPPESQLRSPIVEQYLTAQRASRGLTLKYLGCRLLTLLTVALASGFLGYYCSLAARSDEFVCSLRFGLLSNDSAVPARVQCKLVAAGVFRLLGLVNLAVYLLLVPALLYALLRPGRARADVLAVYQALPAFRTLRLGPAGYSDLSLYSLFLEENLGELKSHKRLKVLRSVGLGAPPAQVLASLGAVKTDAMDGRARPPGAPGQGPPATELR
ncbi:Pannexin-1, partial [Galemys pyrenaicus]